MSPLIKSAIIITASLTVTSCADREAIARCDAAIEIAKTAEAASLFVKGLAGTTHGGRIYNDRDQSDTYDFFIGSRPAPNSYGCVVRSETGREYLMFTDGNIPRHLTTRDIGKSNLLYNSETD